MEDLDYWRLCDGLSIVQAALLIASRDPSSDGAYIEGWGAEKRPVGYEAAKTAISNALRRGLIIGKIIPVYEYDVNGNECGQVTDSIDVAKSRIDVDSLRTWLTGRGLKTGFFFPERTTSGTTLTQNIHDTHPSSRQRFWRGRRLGTKHSPASRRNRRC